ncbi:MAG TPA: glycoside hydrolase family 9 protein [Cyclobacteriaceae bacterium]|nr:glycoside hydrolase family 9 protein [Cyclobacteriaceae bacterium]
MEYLSRPGASVLVFHNFYPSGHQGGIEIIQHGERIATNGFIRLDQVSSQRLEAPLRAPREIDSVNQVIGATVKYENIPFNYTIRVWPEGENIRLAVDLENPIPLEWENKLSFRLEFYPPLYYGKTFHLGESFGIIPRQANGPKVKEDNRNFRAEKMAQGKRLLLAGEDPLRKIVIEDLKGDLTMVDDRNSSGGGWISVKSIISTGVTKNAVEWTISPNIIPGWKRDPMIAVSQVGYHPDQVKQAIIELDPGVGHLNNAVLRKVSDENGTEEILSAKPAEWGNFLCYHYAVFDFSSVKEPGMYIVNYGNQQSNPFSISEKVYKKDVWQPTLEGYFPIQMCHVKVKDRAAIWHNACHLDDALQAPLAQEHVDSYRQYALAETPYPSMTTVPYLNRGGWHDAGDDDLAAGSQASTTLFLALAYELSNNQSDQTFVDFDNLFVEMRRPDGVPDFLQQIKHGAVNLLSGYRAAGHSFAGIIANREGRNIVGDWASQTDQLFYNSKFDEKQKTMTHSGINDDRWVFTNRDTGLEYQVLAALASASRTLKGYDDQLSAECLETAKKAWEYEQSHEPVVKRNAYVPRNQKQEEILATAELLYTTGEEKYLSHLVSLLPAIKENIRSAAWGIARVSERIHDEAFNSGFKEALESYKTSLDSAISANPFGVPWRPAIWGIGWNIQEYALEHYYLIKKYPVLFDPEIVYRVVNYVLGCHPGSSASLVSGVGAHSITNAFGVYRHMEYYIWGGMVSGTALIRPDFPELKEDTPYLWQQSEYVMPGAASYIFCVLATEDLLNSN